MRTLALIAIVVLLWGVGEELMNIRHDFEKAHGLPSIALEKP